MKSLIQNVMQIVFIWLVIFFSLSSSTGIDGILGRNIQLHIHVYSYAEWFSWSCGYPSQTAQRVMSPLVSGLFEVNWSYLIIFLIST